MRATYGGLQLGAVNSTRFTWGRTLTVNRAGVGVGFQWTANFSEVLFRCRSQAECTYLSDLVSTATAVQELDLAVYNDDGTFSDHVAFSGGSLALGKQLAGRSAFGLAAVGTVAAAALCVHHMAGNYIDQQIEGGRRLHDRPPAGRTEHQELRLRGRVDPRDGPRLRPLAGRRLREGRGRRPPAVRGRHPRGLRGPRSSGSRRRRARPSGSGRRAASNSSPARTR